MHVYVMEVSPLLQEGALASCLPLLSDRRREKLTGLKLPADQARSAGAGLLLRHALRDSAGIALERARVAEGPHGKPYLAGHPAVHFSLSHSGRWAACAVDARPVGVDLEEVGPARLPVARRSFAAEDYQYLQGLPERERDLLFAALWTAKESVLKWAGDGLSGGLGEVAVKRRHLCPSAAQYHQARLTLHSLLPEPGVMLTAASAENQQDFQLSVVGLPDLL